MMNAGLGYKTDNILSNQFFILPKTMTTECNHVVLENYIKNTDVFLLLFLKQCILQERRKYDKIGWNISYDFGECDFMVCVQILETYLNKIKDSVDGRIPWSSLKYLVGEVRLLSIVWYLFMFEFNLCSRYLNTLFNNLCSL